MRFIVCFVVGFWSATCFAQEDYKISFSIVGAEQLALNNFPLEYKAKDSLSVYNVANKIISQLQSQGYLLAEIKNISFREKNVSILVNPSRGYQWVNLSSGNLPRHLQQAVGFKEQYFNDVRLDVTRLNQLFNSVLSYYENNGYPFASVHLDSVVIGSNGVSAAIKLNPNQKFVFDTIQVVGSAQVGQKYLQSYLNVKQNTVYIESTIAQVENRLRELPFLQMVKSTEVSFSADKAVVRIFVNKRNANQFDGILGLQQNIATGKSQLVGDLKLRLQNALKVGELLDFSYQGLAGKSQLLDVKANVPHLLNTSFGLSPSLYLYKQDSSFVNVNTKLGFNYLIKGNNSFQFFVENRSTTLVGLANYQAATTLPSMLDASTVFYGLGLNLENLDYRFNPQKGYGFTFDFSVGTKKIKPNSAIPQQLYIGVPLSSTTYRLFSQVSYYKSLSTHTVIAFSNQTAFMSGKYLLENETFRIGGQKSLRGFNELSLLATGYTYGNVELRYLLAQNSFLFAFYNQGYLQYRLSQVTSSDYPLGFGTGINFETNLGILSVSYALGKQKNNPLNLRQGKIHFGITALF